MDLDLLNTITTLITNVGFPIFITLYLLKQNQDEENRHKEEETKLTDALNNNTLALQKLCDKIGDEK